MVSGAPSLDGLDARLVLARLVRPDGAERLLHLRRLPAQGAQKAPWPEFVPAQLRESWAAAGIDAPWVHQARTAELAWAGHSVVVATGTASGKSLCYLQPVLSGALRGASTLYLAPTKALAADQLAAIARLGLSSVSAATCDGDSSLEERDWARRYANVLLTNPDWVHHALVPAHRRWARFLSRLRFVVVDECHTYRGVFGAHVALVLRRLARMARRYGGEPVFLLASATVSDPERSASRLVGQSVLAVTDSSAPRPERWFALWEPETEGRARRSANAEASELMAALVAARVQTLTFVRSRRAAEAVALATRHRLAASGAGEASQVAAYRGGYLPEERRRLEAALREGRLLGLAATSALELGVDVQGLDAVIMAGFPGTRSALLQQAGRAGRKQRPALAVLVARDDPLDTYLVHHPEALLDQPTEATVFDPNNPQVLYPHLAAAAAEAPLVEEDVAAFGPAAPEVLDALRTDGILRLRPAGWFPTGKCTPVAQLRGGGGPAIRLVETGTGRLLGTVEAAGADATVHPGAVYLHQGESYLVRELDLAGAVAIVESTEVDYSTMAKEVTELLILDESCRRGQAVTLAFGSVEVTSQVVAYLRRRLTDGAVLGETPLELPQRRLLTRAVWLSFDAAVLTAAGIGATQRAGAAHAAEHAAIGLLPLFATCDRWDVGGVSTPWHRQTGRTSIFVYDGYPGGAGFAERAYEAGPEWLAASASAIACCRCVDGCPSCIQSPKCPHGNEPLDKVAALGLLNVALRELGSTGGAMASACSQRRAAPRSPRLGAG